MSIKRREFKIFFITILGVFLSTVLLAGFIFIYDILADGPRDFSNPDIFFGYFSNTIGLAIAAAASVIAIILAANALHSAETQTTTLAMQEFKPEINRFVELCNENYEASLELILAAVELSEYGQRLSIACEAGAGSQKEAQAEFNNFENSLKKFRYSVGIIHKNILSSGNKFFQEMIDRNQSRNISYLQSLMVDYREYENDLTASETESGLKASHSPLFHPEYGVDPYSRSFLKIIEGFSMEFPLAALGSVKVDENDRGFDEWNRVGIRDSISKLWPLPSDDVRDISDALSFGCPALPSARDFDFTVYDLSEDMPEGHILSILERFPDPSCVNYICAFEKHSFRPYRYLIPFYISICDPDEGLKAIDDFFVSFGVKKEISHLFTGLSSARLAFNVRPETDLIFRPFLLSANSETKG